MDTDLQIKFTNTVKDVDIRKVINKYSGTDLTYVHELWRMYSLLEDCLAGV